MIFVTVGTHELPFTRLLAEVDRLASAGELPGKIFCQSGSTDLALQVPAARMLNYTEMQNYINAASVVISHGGPGTIMSVLAMGKPLVAVPRQRRFGEHVDDHQVRFCRRLRDERGVHVVEEIEHLASALAKVRGADIVAPRTDSSPDRAVAALGRHIEKLLGSA